MVKKSTKKKIINHVKNVHKLTFIFIILFAILGIGSGLGVTYFLTKNDVFEIIGSSEVTIEIGEEYNEQGAKAIAFGKDISTSVIVSGEVDTNIEGKYVITYTVNHFRFNGYKLYKLVSVVASEEV